MFLARYTFVLHIYDLAQYQILYTLCVQVGYLCSESSGLFRQALL